MLIVAATDELHTSLGELLQCFFPIMTAPYTLALALYVLCNMLKN